MKWSEKRIGGTRGAALLCVMLCIAAPAQAHAAPRAVEFTKAVSYWYLPLEQPGLYRLYHVDVTRVEDLTDGQVTTTALVVTDKCREEWVSEDQFVLYCGENRRERTSHRAALVIADDMSSGKATINLGGRRHVVHFEASENPSRGAFNRRRTCSATDAKLIGGLFTNMERAHGNVLGRRLEGPYTEGFDHAWLEHGVGTWC